MTPRSNSARDPFDHRRAALNRALDRHHLSNKDVFAETAAMKLQVATMQAELERLRSWRDQMFASAPSGEQATS